MNFLEKLDMLMIREGLNKSTLSKGCNIPYTTIDGWYKKGYEGVKLLTVKKLSEYFFVPLDFWIEDASSTIPPSGTTVFSKELMQLYSMLDADDQAVVIRQIKGLLLDEKYQSKAKNA